MQSVSCRCLWLLLLLAVLCPVHRAQNCSAQTCSKCTADGQACLQCQNSYQLRNGSCVKLCQPGYYFNTFLNVCRSCM